MIEALEQEESNLGVAELEGVTLELKEKVAAVMAHEVTHACARHSAQRVVFVVFLVIFFNVLQYIIFLLLQNPLDSYEEELVFKAGKIFSSFSLMNYFFDLVYNKVFSLLECQNSQEQELEADRYSMLYLQRANYRPEAAIWLQEFFAKKFPTPEGMLGWFYRLFLTHPTHKERADQNRKTYEVIRRVKFEVQQLILPSEAKNGL